MKSYLGGSWGLIVPLLKPLGSVLRVSWGVWAAKTTRGRGGCEFLIHVRAVFGRHFQTPFWTPLLDPIFGSRFGPHFGYHSGPHFLDPIFGRHFGSFLAPFFFDIVVWCAL